MERIRDMTLTTRRETEAHSEPQTEKPVGGQSASKLLELPAEVRLLIYDCMTLSPESSECLHWTGAYLACRQLYWEMRNALKPEASLKETTTLSCTGRALHTADFVDIYRLRDPFCLLHVVTIKLPVPEVDFCCERTLIQLYVTLRTK
jgi:hypothetical protein